MCETRSNVTSSRMPSVSCATSRAAVLISVPSAQKRSSRGVLLEAHARSGRGRRREQRRAEELHDAPEDGKLPRGLAFALPLSPASDASRTAAALHCAKAGTAPEPVPTCCCKEEEAAAADDEAEEGAEEGEEKRTTRAAFQRAATASSTAARRARSSSFSASAGIRGARHPLHRPTPCRRPRAPRDTQEAAAAA